MNTYIQQITSTTNLSNQEAWWLLQHVTGKTSVELLLQDSLSAHEEQQLTAYLDQIIHQHKPLAYIIGFVPFLDLKIKVAPPILIPRPETEEWTGQLITALQPYSDKIHKILDLGAGSGVIGLSLARSFPHAQIFAADINPHALALTQENAQLNNVTNITTIESDLFSQLTEHSPFDLIVSNPPYIDPALQINLDHSVAHWEDHRALFSNKEGLEIIEKIMNDGSKYVSRTDLPYQLVFEHDGTQQEAIAQLAQQHGWHCSTKKDLFGQWRTSWCTLK